MSFSREDTEQSVPRRFEHVVRHLPEHIALTGNGRQWTYRELNRRVNRLAHAIRVRTEPGSGCVAFLADQSPEMVIATLAVLKAGKVYLAIHPGMPAEAQREIARDAAPELILATSNLASRAREILSGACALLSFDEVGPTYSEENPEAVTGPDDLSTIFYTSGTTGQPKGVVKSHRAVLHRVWLASQYDGVTPADRQSLLNHCAFSGSESDLFGALLQGATLCVFDIASEGLGAFREWLDREQITVLHPPVLLFRRFLSTLKGRNLFPSVRLVALAGDVVLPGDVERWQRHFTRSCVLMHRFSTTETAVLAVARTEAETIMYPDFVHAGRPAPDKILTLVDENGQPVADGEPGELVVRSRYIAEGYWRRLRETAMAFPAAPDDPTQRIYRTGDMARFLPDGSLVFLGRRDHQVKIRGFRVETGEVESALLKLKEVAEAAVVVTREDDENCLVAFVAPHAGIPFDPPALRERLRAHLPEWKIPARFHPIPLLPSTLTGKVDRQRLERQAGEPGAPAPGGSGTRLASNIEEDLADLWRVTLRRDVVGREDNFLDLGGDSLSAMMIVNWIEQRHGVRLVPATFFRHATIRQLAKLLSGETATAQGAATRTAEVNNVSEAYLELLNAHAVDCMFVNPGTDTAPILESIARWKAEKRRTPELILCLHESVAMAAAHAHFMVSGRPQVVMVHVDVGTQNIGGNLHNAQRDRAGVVICAGRAPYTGDGGVPGGRIRYHQWIQEQFSQASIVQAYVKWHYELTCRENLLPAVERAFQVARAEPSGPVYLILPREVLMQEMRDRVLPALRHPARAGQTADPRSLSLAARWLIEAKNPLILVAYAGRNPKAVPVLVRLAETLGAAVVESRYRVSFPSSHPLHMGFSPARHLPEADCILVIDHDVPWVPAHCQPAPGARIVQVDIDPFKSNIPIWGFPVDLAIQADSSLACAALADEVERQLIPADRVRIESRRSVVAKEHRAQRSLWRQRALDLAESRPIAPEWASYCLNGITNEDTIIIAEAVSNNPALWTYLDLDTPGTYFQTGGSGLGWGLGAALGAKLAAPSKNVICAIGDGAWVFGSPLAAYWAAQQHRSPFMTVIFNNQEYFSTTEAILALAPDGYARKSGYYPACDLPRPPMYSKVAEAMGLWVRTVEEPAELPSALREGLDELCRGRSALVDVCVSSARPDPAPEE